MTLRKHTHGKEVKTVNVELVADNPSELRDALISHGWTPVAGSTRVERTDRVEAILGDLQQALPTIRAIRPSVKRDLLKGRKR